MATATAPVTEKLNTTDSPTIRSVQSQTQRENRSVQSVNTTGSTVNTTIVNTTNEWDIAPIVEAADTGKRIEIRYNRRKAKEPYFYWVYRWAAKDADGNPVKRSSGTYVREYEYGGKLATVDRERLERYEARK